MRAVVIADFAEPSGGAQAVAIQSALSLAALGMPVSYIQGVAGPIDGRLLSAGVDVRSLDLADVWSLPSRQAAIAGIWNRDAARALGTVLAQLPAGPAILHVHIWTRSLSPAAFPVLIASPHPLVMTLHDYFSACPNGVYYRFDKSEPCRLAPLSLPCLVARCDPRSMAHKAIRVIRTAALRRATQGAAFDVIHVSDRGRETLAPFLPGALRQHRIDNPVDAEKRAPAAIPKGGRIVFLGRLTREKGADLAAAAGEAAGLPVLFVGEGPAEAEIRRLSPGATILGWRPRQEVDRILRDEARAVAAPSRWYETGPLTVYEALAAGVPPIVSVRAGASEKVDHGVSGFVVEPNVGTVAEAFRAVANDDAARRMGRLGHERYWSAPLDAAAHAAKLVALYGSILSRTF